MSGAFAGLIASVKAAVASVVNKYWFFLSTNAATRKITVSGSDEAYVMLSNGFNPYIYKIKKDGTFNWSVRVIQNATPIAGQTAGSYQPSSIKVDSSKNLYVIGACYGSFYGNGLVVNKVSDTGTILWSKYYYFDPKPTISHSAIISPSGTLFITGITDENKTSTYPWVAAINTSTGALLWARMQENTGGVASSIRLSPSGNVFGLSVGYLTEMNPTTGAIVSQNRITSQIGSEVSPARDFAVDSAGNFYFSIPSLNRNGNVVFVKLNSSYQLQWSRNLGGTNFGNASENGDSVAVDSAGNVYFLLYRYENINLLLSLPLTLVKYNSSGTLQWAKNYINTSSAYVPPSNTTNGNSAPATKMSLFIDSSDNVHFSLSFYGGQGSGGSFGWSKVRPDGTITGTYTLGTSITATYSDANTSASTQTPGISITSGTNSNPTASSTTFDFGATSQFTASDTPGATTYSYLN